MVATEPDQLRVALRAALIAAMKSRDVSAVNTYRVALAAIDNAQAVPLREEHRAGAIEMSPVGLGVTDVPRRTLTKQQTARIVRQEAADRRVAADLLRAERPDRAAALDRDADLLETIVERWHRSG
jgi:uncharacterized protein YqeY